MVLGVKSVNTKEFENNIKRLVDENYTDLSTAVLPHLDDFSDLAVFNLAMMEYPYGRWYDKWGIPDTKLETIFIAKKEGKDVGIVSAIHSLHDSKYRSTENTGDFNKIDIRIFHMEEGGRFAREELPKLRTIYEEPMFSDEKVDTIATVIENHDFHYLGPEIPSVIKNDLVLYDLFRTFEDCDRTFVPNFFSVCKNYITQSAEDSEYNIYLNSIFEDRDNRLTGLEFIKTEISTFFKKGDPEIKGIEIEDEYFDGVKDKEKKGLIKFKPPYLNTTKGIIVAHFKARIDEYKKEMFDAIAETDWDHFEPFIKDYIENSISTTKNHGVSYDIKRFGVK